MTESDRHELRRLAEDLRRRIDSIEKILGPKDGWERGCYWPADDKFQYGTRVMATENRDDGSWQPEARLKCRWGMEGIVVDRSDSHGLCYRVRHADGSDAWYNPDEIRGV